MRSRSWHVAVLVFAVLALAALSFSQSATTSLRGTISDAKGAVVAGATVLLTNNATGFSRTVKTDDQGTYQFLEIPPATYVISASAEGFSTTKRENVVLQVSSPATMNLSLQVQGSNVIVDVSGEAPVVNTQDATLGNNFGQRQLIDLPSEGRDPVSILSLQPGVVYLGNKVDQNDDSRGGAINGARSDQTNVTLDGLDDNDQLQGYAFQGAMRSTLDSLQEFRVTTSNYDASAGRSSGAQVNLVTKSGTNNFHGSLYEYHRPSFDVANDYFNKASQLSLGLPNRPQHILRNTFGGTVGGPIIKDRLFFFAAYEGQRTADQQQITRIVPTPSLAQGQLKYLCESERSELRSWRSELQRSHRRSGRLRLPRLQRCHTLARPGCFARSGLHRQRHLSSRSGTGPSHSQHWRCESQRPVRPLSGAKLPKLRKCDQRQWRPSEYVGISPFPATTPLDSIRTSLNSITESRRMAITRCSFEEICRTTTKKLRRSFRWIPSRTSLFLNSIRTNNSKGIAAGYTWIMRNNLINNLRYAFIRQGLADAGLNSQPFNRLRGLDDIVGLTSTVLTNVPVNNFIDDVSWTKGHHTIQLGTNWRLIRNNRQSNAQNLSEGYANLYWMNPSFIAGTGASLDPAHQFGVSARG